MHWFLIFSNMVLNMVLNLQLNLVLNSISVNEQTFQWKYDPVPLEKPKISVLKKLKNISVSWMLDGCRFLLFLDQYTFKECCFREKQHLFFANVFTYALIMWIIRIKPFMLDIWLFKALIESSFNLSELILWKVNSENSFFFYFNPILGAVRGRG